MLIIFLVCGLLGLALVLSFLIFCWLTSEKKQSSVPTLLKDPFLNISYRELLKATDGFSSANLIGMGSFGSVYKGILESDKSVVAVKVLKLQRKGASKSFMTEC